MEPRRERQQGRHFRIVKLEERIAPSTVHPMGGKVTRACQSVGECQTVIWTCFPATTSPPGQCK